MLLSFPLAFIGVPEGIIVVVLLVLLFGAKKLPALARGVGESIVEFKKARTDLDAESEKTEAASKPLPSSDDKSAS